MTSKISIAERNCIIESFPRILLIPDAFSFGENTRSLPRIRSYLEVLWDQCDEFLVLLLLVFATVSLVASFWSDVPYKWLESVSIYFAVAFAAMIQSLCDYGKERQFLNLRSEIMNE